MGAQGVHQSSLSVGLLRIQQVASASWKVIETKRKSEKQRRSGSPGDKLKHGFCFMIFIRWKGSEERCQNQEPLQR
jgi:hypothetical protein